MEISQKSRQCPQKIPTPVAFSTTRIAPRPARRDVSHLLPQRLALPPQSSALLFLLSLEAFSLAEANLANPKGFCVLGGQIYDVYVCMYIYIYTFIYIYVDMYIYM